MAHKQRWRARPVSWPVGYSPDEHYGSGRILPDHYVIEVEITDGTRTEVGRRVGVQLTARQARQIAAQLNGYADRQDRKALA